VRRHDLVQRRDQRAVELDRDDPAAPRGKPDSQRADTGADLEHVIVERRP